MDEHTETSTGAPSPELSIVIPVYNEPGTIGPVLERLSANVRTPHEVLIVYDFDEDSTVPAVKALQGQMPSVRLLRNRLGRGVLNAMKAGIAEAEAPYLLITMADGSDEIELADRMVGLARNGADLVAASRYAKGGRQIGGPRLKRTLSRIAGISLNSLGILPIHDATNNFRLYRRGYLQEVQIESTGGFELALELSVKAAIAGRTLAEIPTTWRDRSEGKSQFKLWAWLPRYTRWYLYAIGARFGRRHSRS